VNMSVRLRELISTSEINNWLINRCLSKIHFYISLSLLIIFIFLLFYLGQVNPKLGWDGLAYATIAIGYDDNNKDEVHEKVYADYRLYLDEDALIDVTKKNQYKVDTANNTEIFFNQIPWYTVKPLYPLLIKAAMQTGMDPVRSELVVSGLAFVFCGLFVFMWLTHLANPYVSMILTSLILTTPEIFNISRFTTPDMLSTSIVLLSFYMYLVKGKTNLSFFILVISLFSRPDNIIFYLLLVGGSFLIKKISFRNATLAVASGLAVYIVQSKLSGHYGWQTLFFHSFVERLDDPASFVPYFGLIDYLKVYQDQVVSLVLSSNIPMYVIMAIVGFIVSTGASEKVRDMRVMNILMLIYMFGHIVAFPGEKERLFATVYLLLIMILITSIVYSRYSDDIENEREE
jgi:hypothetical protein